MSARTTANKRTERAERPPNPMNGNRPATARCRAVAVLSRSAASSEIRSEQLAVQKREGGGKKSGSKKPTLSTFWSHTCNFRTKPLQIRKLSSIFATYEFRKAYGSPKRSGKDCGGPKICVKLRHYYLNSSKRAVAFFISLIYKNHTDLRGNERIIRTPGTHPKPPASRRVRPRRVPPHGRIRTSRSCRPAAAPARRAGKGGTSTARYAAA